MQRTSHLFFLLLFSLPSLLRAQSTSASLTGVVNDPSKAAVVDATVIVISTATNVRFETKTNGAGQYHVANLDPGTYRLEIEKQGFKKLVKPDVILHVQDALVIDFGLSLGEMSE